MNRYLNFEMLTQEHSIELDSVVHIYPNHIKAIDVAAKLVETSADLTLENDTIYKLLMLSKVSLTLN